MQYLEKFFIKEKTDLGYHPEFCSEYLLFKKSRHLIRFIQQHELLGNINNKPRILVDIACGTYKDGYNFNSNEWLVANAENPDLPAILLCIDPKISEAVKNPHPKISPGDPHWLKHYPNASAIMVNTKAEDNNLNKLLINNADHVLMLAIIGESFSDSIDLISTGYRFIKPETGLLTIVLDYTFLEASDKHCNLKSLDIIKFINEQLAQMPFIPQINANQKPFDNNSRSIPTMTSQQYYSQGYPQTVFIKKNEPLLLIKVRKMSTVY